MKVLDVICESKMVWARRGNKLSRKHRCTAGPRKGRIVASPDQCFKPIDVQKRVAMKKTKAAKGPRMSKRASRAKKYNIASKVLRILNKGR